MKAIINGRLIVPDDLGQFQIVDHQTLLYNEKVIRLVPEMEFRSEEEKASLDEVIDAKGNYVAPGFFNVHLHGSVGYDVMDDDPDALPAIAKFQASTGVTSMLPTTNTYDFKSIERAFEKIRYYMYNQPENSARILGAHMEGPFINPRKHGSQRLEYIAEPDINRVLPYKDIIVLITIAPEMLHGDYSFIEQCIMNRIYVSAGHTSLDYTTARRLILQYGVNHITHLFNGMLPLHHRTPGLVGVALDTPVDCEIIADNVHLHPMTQRLIWRMKQGRHIILTTDSLRACGLGDGESEFGGQVVHVCGQVATLEDGTIAGSVLTMDRAIANFAANTGASLAMTVSYATKVPAEGLGFYDRIGSLESGKLADMVIFDSTVHIKATIIGGQVVYHTQDFFDE